MAGLRYAPDLLQIRRVTPTRVHLSLQAALVPGACCLVPGNLHSSTLFANEKASKPASRNVCGPDKLTTSRGTAPGSWRSRRCRTGAEKSKKWQLLIQFRALSGHRRIKMPLCKFSIVLVCVCRWSSTSVLLLPLPLATRHLLRLLHFHFIFWLPQFDTNNSIMESERKPTRILAKGADADQDRHQKRKLNEIEMENKRKRGQETKKRG